MVHEIALLTLSFVISFVSDFDVLLHETITTNIKAERFIDINVLKFIKYFLCLAVDGITMLHQKQRLYFILELFNGIIE